MIDHPIQPLSNTSFPEQTRSHKPRAAWLTALLESLERDTDLSVLSRNADDSGTVERTIENGAAARLWQDTLTEYAERLGKDARERPDYFADRVAALLRRYRLADAGPSGSRSRHSQVVSAPHPRRPTTTPPPSIRRRC